MSRFRDILFEGAHVHFCCSALAKQHPNTVISEVTKRERTCSTACWKHVQLRVLCRVRPTSRRVGFTSKGSVGDLRDAVPNPSGEGETEHRLGKPPKRGQGVSSLLIFNIIHRKHMVKPPRNRQVQDLVYAPCEKARCLPGEEREDVSHPGSDGLHLVASCY